jgi:energy-coupling factor transport system substrate-specific component
MSWQLASFAVLGLVLLGGFAWYERSRPPSQIVALVAALAALAVAGRLVLAPIPNVVATTDIVIFSGYALGGAPGFAVGALAGLISNFWLGQGPWTPWQMAGWGLAGILGALLARVSGRRAGRLELTVACGFAGIAFGALLNFSLMVSYGGEMTVQRWLALEARAVPFDLAHAIGNIALALVAGPAMVRMLVRFRERFEFRWQPPQRSGTVAGAAGAATLLLALGRAGLPKPATRTAASRRPPAPARARR